MKPDHWQCLSNNNHDDDAQQSRQQRRLQPVNETLVESYQHQVPQSVTDQLDMYSSNRTSATPAMLLNTSGVNGLTTQQHQAVAALDLDCGAIVASPGTNESSKENKQSPQSLSMMMDLHHHHHHHHQNHHHQQHHVAATSISGTESMIGGLTNNSGSGADALSGKTSRRSRPQLLMQLLTCGQSQNSVCPSAPTVQSQQQSTCSSLHHHTMHNRLPTMSTPGSSLDAEMMSLMASQHTADASMMPPNLANHAPHQHHQLDPCHPDVFDYPAAAMLASRQDVALGYQQHQQQQQQHASPMVQLTRHIDCNTESTYPRRMAPEYSGVVGSHHRMMSRTPNTPVEMMPATNQPSSTVDPVDFAIRKPVFTANDSMLYNRQNLFDKPQHPFQQQQHTHQLPLSSMYHPDQQAHQPATSVQHLNIPSQQQQQHQQQQQQQQQHQQQHQQQQKQLCCQSSMHNLPLLMADGMIQPTGVMSATDSSPSASSTAVVRSNATPAVVGTVPPTSTRKRQTAAKRSGANRNNGSNAGQTKPRRIRKVAAQQDQQQASRKTVVDQSSTRLPQLLPGSLNYCRFMAFLPLPSIDGDDADIDQIRIKPIKEDPEEREQIVRLVLEACPNIPNVPDEFEDVIRDEFRNTFIEAIESPAWFAEETNWMTHALQTAQQEHEKLMKRHQCRAPDASAPPGNATVDVTSNNNNNNVSTPCSRHHMQQSRQSDATTLIQIPADVMDGAGNIQQVTNHQHSSRCSSRQMVVGDFNITAHIDDRMSVDGRITPVNSSTPPTMHMQAMCQMSGVDPRLMMPANHPAMQGGGYVNGGGMVRTNYGPSTTTMMMMVDPSSGPMAGPLPRLIFSGNRMMIDDHRMLPAGYHQMHHPAMVHVSPIMMHQQQQQQQTSSAVMAARQQQQDFYAAANHHEQQRYRLYDDGCTPYRTTMMPPGDPGGNIVFATRRRLQGSDMVTVGPPAVHVMSDSNSVVH